MFGFLMKTLELEHQCLSTSRHVNWCMFWALQMTTLRLVTESGQMVSERITGKKNLIIILTADLAGLLLRLRLVSVLAFRGYLLG